MVNFTIRPQLDESMDNVLRRFRKEVQRSGLNSDLRRAAFFASKSARRREKSGRAQARRKKHEVQ